MSCEKIISAYVAHLASPNDFNILLWVSNAVGNDKPTYVHFDIFVVEEVKLTLGADHLLYLIRFFRYKLYHIIYVHLTDMDGCQGVKDECKIAGYWVTNRSDEVGDLVLSVWRVPD